jgi:hypothetical protein
MVYDRMSAVMSSQYIERLVEESRKCAVAAAIRNIRCQGCQVPPAQQQPAASSGSLLAARIQQCSGGGAPQRSQATSESRRIQDAINTANACFDPANTNYTRPPLPPICPPIPAEYLSAGVGRSQPRFPCYDSVVGFI